MSVRLGGLVAATLSCLTPLVARPAVAQEAAFTLRGQVLRFPDDVPVSGAVVQIEELARATLSDESGIFTFQDLAPGTYTFAVSHIAFRSSRQASRVFPGSVLFVRLAERTIPLDSLVVTVAPVPAALERIERRRLAYGFRSFAMGPEQLATAAAAPSLPEHVATRAGVPLRSCPGAFPGERECWSVRGGLTRVSVTLDGMRLFGGVTTLNMMPRRALAVIEIYPTDGCIRAYTHRHVRVASEKGWLVRPFMDPC